VNHTVLWLGIVNTVQSEIFFLEGWDQKHRLKPTKKMLIWKKKSTLTAVLIIPRPHFFQTVTFCSVLRDDILHLRRACGDITLLWFNCGHVVLKRWGSYLGNSSLFLHRLANGAGKCHETQTLLYRCSCVRRAFLFQFWAGSSAFSPLNAYLVFSQQNLSKDCVAAALSWEIKDWWSCAKTRLKTRTKVHSIRIDTLIRCKPRRAG